MDLETVTQGPVDCCTYVAIAAAASLLIPVKNRAKSGPASPLISVCRLLINQKDRSEKEKRLIHQLQPQAIYAARLTGHPFKA